MFLDANKNKMTWFRLHFSDEDGKHLGCCFVRSLDTEDVSGAAKLAHERGCNPGGAVACWEIPDETMAGIPENKRYKLLNCKDASKLLEKAAS